MAGVGYETNKVYPTNITNRGFDRGPDNIAARSHTEGGGAASRMKKADERYDTVHSMMTFEEARTSEFRRKTPLFHPYKKKAKKSEERTPEEIMRQKHGEFIKANFHEVECGLFVPDKKQDSETMKIKDIKCYCGEVLMGHSAMQKENYQLEEGLDRAQDWLIPRDLRKLFDFKNLENTCTIRDLPSVDWNHEDNLKSKPAKCFGKINFVNVELRGGKKPAKYVRIGANDSVDKLLELMEDHWKIMEPQGPSLVISVVGGAKNCKLDGKSRETFSTGLIKAAKTTNAWLITSGFNMGVMKYVGMAVSEGQSFVWHNERMAHLLRCIAIAPWGYVQDRKTLECYSRFTSANNDDTLPGKFNADYKTSNIIQHKKPVPLNANHTHFVFVDEGWRNSYEKSQKCAEFRAKFENKLQMPEEQGGKGIPVVLVVVEGGPDALNDATNSLKQDIPVVICSGTGRAANILSYAYQNSHNGHINSISEEESLRKKIIKHFGSRWSDADKEQRVNKIMDNIKICIQKKHLMVDFHMQTQEDLDIAILSALLKAKSDDASEEQRLKQLELALTWDRVDIAQEDIFREDCLWSAGALDKILFDAIAQEKVEFVQLILQQGVVMKEFLTKKRILDLYNEALKSKISQSMFFKKLLSRYYVYKENEKDRANAPLQMKYIAQLITHLLDRYDASFECVVGDEKKVYKTWDTNQLVSDDELQCKWPYRELLIYSVLLMKPNLAKFAWEMGREPVTSAIAVTRMLDKMSSFIHTNEGTLKEQVNTYKKEFENLAISVLNQCHLKDQEKAIMLVERRSPSWSKMSSLEIAAAGKAQAYIASVACQNSLGATWKRGIKSHWHRVGLAMFLPFLIPTKFLEINSIGEKNLNFIQKLILFYTAPITKFALYMIGYSVFLLLFTYMLLVDFSWNRITNIEIICIAWFFTFLVDDIYTVLSVPAPTLYGKVKKYIKGQSFMFINFILALIGFCLHTQGSKHAMATKVLYSINIILIYLKLMKAYTANRSLGPKLVMIKQMFKELLLFLVVLVVFLLAYGVSSQALLYKERNAASWEVLKEVVYHPYWQVYGEIYLEEIQSDDSCLSAAVDSSIGTNGTTMATDASLYCRQEYWLVYFFLAAYLMIGNVLLLNLLIAIFSNVFNSIEENSFEIWKYHWYYLTMEFDVKTALIPPISFIVHVYLLFSYILRKTCCKRQKRDPYSQKHHEYLQLFEKEELTNILRNRKEAEKGSIEKQIIKLRKRVEELQKVIEDEYAYELADSVNKRMEKLESLITEKTWPSPKRVLNVEQNKAEQIEKTKDILAKEKEKLEAVAKSSGIIPEGVAETLEKANDLLEDEDEKARRKRERKEKKKKKKEKKEKKERERREKEEQEKLNNINKDSPKSKGSEVKDLTFENANLQQRNLVSSTVDFLATRQASSEKLPVSMRSFRPSPSNFSNLSSSSDDDENASIRHSSSLLNVRPGVRRRLSRQLSDDDTDQNRPVSPRHKSFKFKSRDSSTEDDWTSHRRRHKSPKLKVAQMSESD